MAIEIRRRPDDCSRVVIDSRLLRKLDVPLSPYLKAINEKFTREFDELAAKLKAYFEQK